MGETDCQSSFLYLNQLYAYALTSVKFVFVTKHIDANRVICLGSPKAQYKHSHNSNVRLPHSYKFR